MNINKIFKYSIVGGTAFIVDFSIFYTAINFFEINYFVSGFYSFIAGVFVNYLLARRFVFYNHNKVKKSTEFFGVYLISGIGLLIHQFTIYSLVEFINSDIYISKILASAIVFLWNYNMRRKYLYGELL
tara:strand:- start:112 stop:498 length:387 start_codon:yes stop_codon:yes gene_type:complete